MVADIPSIADITPEEALQRHEQGAVLLDVREGDEWAAGHAPGAVHVPLASVEAAASRFTDREVLTICRSGARSTQAAQSLTEAGIAASNVAGGMTSWATAGLPVVRDDGTPGVVA